MTLLLVCIMAWRCNDTGILIILDLQYISWCLGSRGLSAIRVHLGQLFLLIYYYFGHRLNQSTCKAITFFVNKNFVRNHTSFRVNTNDSHQRDYVKTVLCQTGVKKKKPFSSIF